MYLTIVWCLFSPPIMLIIGLSIKMAFNQYGCSIMDKNMHTRLLYSYCAGPWTIRVQWAWQYATSLSSSRRRLLERRPLERRLSSCMHTLKDSILQHLQWPDISWSVSVLKICSGSGLWWNGTETTCARLSTPSLPPLTGSLYSTVTQMVWYMYHIS